MNFFSVVESLLAQSGFAALTWQQAVMIVVSFVLMYMAIVKKFEPLLLLPISFGMFLTNLPLTGLMEYGAGTQTFSEGVLGMVYNACVSSELFPCIMFLAVGAMTDFGPLLANPISLILGAAAQFGIYIAFIVANLSGLYRPTEAAAIGIIGGADGPTAIYTATKLCPSLVPAIAVAAYSYMALIPLIQPPIMKLLTTDKMRKVKMKQLRTVSKTEKVVFPIFVVLLCSLLLSDVAQNALCNISTIWLGLTVGATAKAANFLTVQTLGIVALGLMAFAFSTVGGLLLGDLLYVVTGGKINPLIGSAGVSAVPMAARVSQVEGAKYDRTNFLLMHAMGPNVSGVIGSAVAAGFFLTIFKI